MARRPIGPRRESRASLRDPPICPTVVPILRLQRVSKTYGRRLILHDVDLTLGRGSFNLVVGPNASGKTTLLRMMSTTVRPTTGSVGWTDKPGATSDRMRARIGYAGHTPLIYDELTARENLEFVLRIRGRTPTEARRGADRWLDAFGLAPRSQERVLTYSRGLRQRLALAQAFAPDPDLLLLDEPASNLDAQGAEALLSQLKLTKGQVTVVLATHEPDPYRPLADRTLELRDGRVHDWGGAP